MANDESADPAAAPPQARAAPESPADARADASRKRRFFLVLFGVIILVLLAAFFWWLHARNYEGTDDAFIDARLVHVSPRIAGRVQRVDVTDNVAVHVGEELLTLDPADSGAHYDQAAATVKQAQAQLAQASTHVAVSEAGLRQARASTAGISAQAANAVTDLKRYRGLKAAFPGAVSSQQLDQAQTTATNLLEQQKASSQQVASAQKQIDAAEAEVASAMAQLATAQAQLEQARLNLSYNGLVASVDGTVAQQTVAVGDYVQPGEQLLAIVPRTIWVTGNFKETQLTLMRPGQKVDLKIYAYPNVHFVGHVDSIQRGAGQAFSLLPAQNATGNFVKVVQRVPVKILIDSPRDSRYVLGPGMSVYATVHVR